MRMNAAKKTCFLRRPFERPTSFEKLARELSLLRWLLSRRLSLPLGVFLFRDFSPDRGVYSCGGDRDRDRDRDAAVVSMMDPHRLCCSSGNI